VKHLPNLLTAARLALAPYLFLLMFRHQYSTIIPLFILIGVTDVVDGFLARRYGASSRLGAYLDPIADKVLLSGTFLVLALTGALEPWLAVVVLGCSQVINWLSYYVPVVHYLTRHEPVPLIQDGRVLHDQLRRELMTEGRLLGKLRGEGVTDPAEVAEAWMESDGHISVVKRRPGPPAGSKLVEV